jgi:hypothetical protein
MDETQDPKPHVHFNEASPLPRRETLSIWFFCGILTLGYGIVLIAQALLEHFRIWGQHPANTVLARLHPTFWWGFGLFLFGAFYTFRFRPRKG